jgi:hypothetical protein
VAACSQKEKRNVVQPTEQAAPPAVTYDYAPAAPKTESTQDNERTKEVQAAVPVQEHVKDIEDAYEEGAAQAEEDRLAGHPGMNYADDYEDDDENEAYEEGYEDE